MLCFFYLGLNDFLTLNVKKKITFSTETSFTQLFPVASFYMAILKQILCFYIVSELFYNCNNSLKKRTLFLFTWENVKEKKKSTKSYQCSFHFTQVHLNIRYCKTRMPAVFSYFCLSHFPEVFTCTQVSLLGPLYSTVI